MSELLHRCLIGVIASGVIIAAACTASAQWLQHHLLNAPRRPDGTVDLRAPAPRTADGKPDLSGIWAAERNRPAGALGPGFAGNRHNENLAADLPGGAPLTPWARAILDERRKTRAIPTERCLPAGIPPDMLRPQLPFKMIQTQAVVVVLLEEFNNWRQIHLDGRPHPTNPEPAFLGYSVGAWDGDTLLVTTTGINDKTWLDGSGLPHSAALRMTERIRRVDFGRMEITFMFEDAQAFTGPWSATVGFDLQPDTELLEHQCENDKWRAMAR